MLLPAALALWTIHYQFVVCVSPSTLVALANVQNQKAKTIANALNLHAKSKYNAALRKSKIHQAKLGERRIPRNAGQFDPTRQEHLPDADNISFNSQEGIGMEVPPKPPIFSSSDEIMLDERVGEGTVKMNGDFNSNDERRRLHIPLNTAMVDEDKSTKPSDDQASSNFQQQNKPGAIPSSQGRIEDFEKERVKSPHLFSHGLFHKEKTIITHDKSHDVKVVTPAVNININPGHSATLLPQQTVIQHGITNYPTTTITDTRPVFGEGHFQQSVTDSRPVFSGGHFQQSITDTRPTFSEGHFQQSVDVHQSSVTNHNSGGHFQQSITNTKPVFTGGGFQQSVDLHESSATNHNSGGHTQQSVTNTKPVFTGGGFQQSVDLHESSVTNHNSGGNFQQSIINTKPIFTGGGFQQSVDLHENSATNHNSGGHFQQSVTNTKPVYTGGGFQQTVNLHESSATNHNSGGHFQQSTTNTGPVFTGGEFQQSVDIRGNSIHNPSSGGFFQKIVDKFHGNKQHVVHKEFTHEHSPGFVRNEFIHQKNILGQPQEELSCGFLHEPEGEREALVDVNFENRQRYGDADLNERSFQEVQSIGRNSAQFDDEDRLGTFQIPGFNVEPPNFPDHFDPTEPQNKQSIVRYIENEQMTFNKLLHFVRGFSENLKTHKPLDLPHFKHFGHFYSYGRDASGDQTGKELAESRTSQARGVESNEIDDNDNNNISEDVGVLTPEMQEKALEEYFETERNNFQNNLHVLQEEHQHNLNSLLHSLHLSPIAEPSAPINHNGLFENNDRLRELSRFNDDRQIWKKFSEQTARMEPNREDLLGNLFNVPSNQFYDFQRTARSLNDTAHRDLQKMISEEKRIINQIKKHAKHDEDLMLIGYIGDNLIKDIEERRNKTGRRKRNTPQDDIRRLITDPISKLDVPRTFENLGAAARATFEHETAPIYHVRNLVGSAKDAVVAAMKIPNQNFIIPSRYKIVNIDTPDSKLPKMNDLGEDTFQRVGSVLRDSVKSSQDAVNHIGEVANHGKKAVNTLHHSTPRLILRRTASAVSPQQAILVVPRILEISNENEETERTASQGIWEPDYVRLGHIFDAIALSNQNTHLQLQKIIFNPHTDPTRLDSIVGATLNNLQDAQMSIGAKSLRDFFEIIKRHLQSILKQDVLGRILNEKKMKKYHDQKHGITGPTLDSEIAANGKIKDVSQQFNTTSEAKDNETVGLLLPEYLLHPFMNRATPDLLKRFSEEHALKQSSQNKNEEMNRWEENAQVEPVLGAINPVMFQRILDESLKVKDTNNDHDIDSVPQNHITDQDVDHKTVNEDRDHEKVGTSMLVTGEILKPFMGQATKKNLKDFLDRYKPKNIKQDFKNEKAFDQIFFEPVENYH